jgi:hypothetical protein
MSLQEEVTQDRKAITEECKKGERERESEREREREVSGLKLFPTGIPDTATSAF